MFALSKLVKPFLWPPGIFVLVFVGVGIGYAARRRAGPAVTCLGIALVLWGTAVSPVADGLLRPLERQYDRPLPTEGDVIVMLGGAVHAGARDMDGTGAPSAEACERLLATARLYRRTGLPIILSGGRVHAHQTLMGPIYRRFLVTLGVPPDRILLESRSRNTFENARASWELCRRRGFRRPLVITHAAHMPRAMFCFRKLGIPARPAPCGFRTWEGKAYRWPDFLPRSFEGVARALHEYLGLWFYRWQYRSVDAVP
jgi:uncharacterized SAM-binding protein YcdF (DUF218 family)